MEKEIYKTVEEFPDYQISNLGNVRNAKTGKMLKQHNNGGYKSVSICRKTRRVHRLIAFAFIFNPNPKEFDCINHIDGDKLNNSISNLEWCTRSYNTRHYLYELGGLESGILKVLNKKKITIYPYKRGNKPWRALLSVPGVHSTSRTLGYFKTYDEALAVFLAAYKEQYGVSYYDEITNVPAA